MSCWMRARCALMLCLSSVLLPSAFFARADDYPPADNAPEAAFAADLPNISSQLLEFEAELFHQIGLWVAANEEIRYQAQVVEQARRDYDRALTLYSQSAMA